MKKRDAIDIILTKYTTVQNKEYLWKFVNQYGRMSENEWNELLEANGITTWSQIFKIVEDYLSTLSETRIGPAKPIYTQRIYEDEKLRSIIQNASEIENPTALRKSYYIAHELSKILGENPSMVFIPVEEQIRRADEPVTEDYKAICKTSSELYANMLKEVGVYAELVRKQLDAEYPHIETVVFAGDEKYDVNLIQHFMQVQTNRFMRNFAKRPTDMLFKKRIEDIYGRLGEVPNSEIKKMDEEFGFVKKRTENGKATYYDEMLNNYLLACNAEASQMSDAEFFEKAPQIIQNYISFFRSREKFEENMGFQELDYHYINAIVKGINGIELKDRRGLDIKQRYFCKNGDLNDLLVAWRIEAGGGNIKYFIYDSKPMREISKEELQEILATNEISIPNRGQKLLTDETEINKIIENFFEDGTIIKLEDDDREESHAQGVGEKVKNIFARIKAKIFKPNTLNAGEERRRREIEHNASLANEGTRQNGGQRESVSKDALAKYKVPESDLKKSKATPARKNENKENKYRFL